MEEIIKVVVDAITKFDKIEASMIIFFGSLLTIAIVAAIWKLLASTK